MKLLFRFFTELRFHTPSIFLAFSHFPSCNIFGFALVISMLNTVYRLIMLDRYTFSTDKKFFGDFCYFYLLIKYNHCRLSLSSVWNQNCVGCKLENKCRTPSFTSFFVVRHVATVLLLFLLFWESVEEQERQSESEEWDRGRHIQVSQVVQVRATCFSWMFRNNLYFGLSCLPRVES